MSYQLEINSIIEFLTAFAGMACILILWKYRSTLGVKYIIYLEAFVVFWAVAYAFEFGTTVLEQKITWSKISYLGIAFTPVCYFLFTTAFSQKTKILTNRNIGLLSILPLITIVLVFTNEHHHLIWTDVVADEKMNIAHYYHGAWFWLFIVYTEVLILMGLFNLISSFYKFSSYYRGQIYTLLIATLIPVIGNFIYLTGLNPFPGFDWTPVSFVLTGFIIAVGVIRFRMFDIIPIARNKLLDSINNIIVVINPEGKIEDYNQAAPELIESNEGNIIGQPFEKIFPMCKSIVKEFDREEDRFIEFSFEKNGRKVFYDINISPLFFRKKILSGYLVNFNNVTHLKQTEETLIGTNKQLLHEIEKKEKLIGDLDAFAHTVAHDIKNPLGAIVSTSNLFMENIDSLDTETTKELINMILVSANKGVHITNELLTLASVRQQKIKTEHVDMEHVFTEAKVRLYSLINEKDARIKKPASWPVSIGYSAWIEEVWFNYLSNALKYGGYPPEIVVGAKKLDNGYTKFWISDNGNGIQEEDKQLIFNQFTRLEPEQSPGHGLGLSIVKRIIEKLGGSVGIESSGKKGEGSLFYFTLPSA